MTQRKMNLRFKIKVLIVVFSIAQFWCVIFFYVKLSQAKADLGILYENNMLYERHISNLKDKVGEEPLKIISEIDKTSKAYVDIVYDKTQGLVDVLAIVLLAILVYSFTLWMLISKISI